MCDVPVSDNEGNLLTSVLASRLDKFEVLNRNSFKFKPGSPESLRMEYSLWTSFGLECGRCEASPQAQAQPYSTSKVV